MTKTETGSTQLELWPREVLKELAGPAMAQKMAEDAERVLVPRALWTKFWYTLPAELFGKDRVITSTHGIAMPEGLTRGEYRELVARRYDEAVAGMLMHYDAYVDKFDRIDEEQKAAPVGT
jgi:hypothetical protein